MLVRYHVILATINDLCSLLLYHSPGHLQKMFGTASHTIHPLEFSAVQANGSYRWLKFERHGTQLRRAKTISSLISL